MNKLIVAGCSFSDYSQVDEVYGEILAAKLGYEYVHEGSGCGSNHRIWRVIGNHINNNLITENDLLIIQYTSLERREFWSHNHAPQGSARAVNLQEPYHRGGSLIKYKSFASQWQRHQEEKDFLDLYEKYFCSQFYEDDCFRVLNSFFQSFLAYRKIKVCFLETIYCRQLAHYGMLNEHKNLYYTWLKNEHDTALHLKPNEDRWHLSRQGHWQLAGDLYEHLRDKI